MKEVLMKFFTYKQFLSFLTNDFEDELKINVLIFLRLMILHEYEVVNQEIPNLVEVLNKILTESSNPDIIA